MTDPISTCGDHGYVAGESCPVCGARAERVLTGERRRRLSKFVSGALRHFPDDAGIGLDESGWTAFDDLADAVEGQYDWATSEHLAGVVATDPKGRFERDERDGTPVVRAAYGHSVDVDLSDEGGPVPDELYHGTAPRNLDAIRSEGLKPMGRRQVHLSGSVADAREVGARHAGDPVILTVDAAAMLADGRSIAKRGESTYTTDAVPPQFVAVLEA